MRTVPSAIREFAGRLIALEAARDGPTGAAVRVCDRLRVPLVRLSGVAGFRSLLSRALALAKAEVASLNEVQIREDASLEGFAGPGGDGGTALVVQLLGLLVTFIGEPLTRQLVRDAWPDAASDETDQTAEGQP